jgi:hypothetical protein
MSTIDVGRWADTLMARYADRVVIGNALYEIAAHADPAVALELEPHALDCHPVPFLRTFRPAPSCVALGLVSAGWAAPMGSRVRPSAHPEAKRILQVVVVTSDGEVGGRVRFPDGSIVDSGPGYGRVLDALRSALRRRAA